MKQFKALLLKEWQTHWKNLLVPAWATLGFYLVILLGLILSMIKGSDITFMSKDIGMVSVIANSVLLSATFAVTAILGFVGIVNAISLSDNMINGGYKRKCEILHLSQPVSLLKILSTRYLMMTLGSVLILAFISLINSMGISLILNYLHGAQIYYGFMGWLLISVELSLSLLFASSLFWFFASVFPRKSFFMGVLVIGAIQVATSILNFMAGFRIPSLVGYLLRLGTVSVDSNNNAGSVGLINQIDHVFSYRWSLIWNIDSLMKISLSAVFFVLAYFLIKRRELS